MADETASQKIAREMVGRFPMSAPPVPRTRVDGNSYWVEVVEAKLSLNKTAPIEQVGRLDVKQSVDSQEALDGFDGGAIFTFMDEAGNTIYKMVGNGHGVNGKDVPGKDSRTDFDTYFIDLAILTAVRSFKADVIRTDGDFGKKAADAVKEFANAADAMKGDLGRIAADVGAIYAAIAAL